MLKKQISSLRLWFVWSMLLLLAFGLPGVSFANHFEVGQEANYPPFIYQDETGVPKGISVDYLRLVESKLQHDFSFSKPLSLPDIFDKLKNGELDLVTSIKATPEREEFLVFSDPYISVPAVLVLPRESKVEKVEDLLGKKVAVGRGYAAENFLRNSFPNLSLILEDNDEEGLFDLVLGQVDAVVMDVASASYLIQEHAVTTVKIGRDIGFTYNLSFASPKSQEQLIEEINSALAQVTQEEMNELQVKWFGISWDSDPEPDLFSRPIVRIALSIIVSVALLTIAWIYTLRRLINKKTKQLEAVNRELDSRVKKRTQELEDAKSELEKNLSQLKKSEQKVKKNS